MTHQTVRPEERAGIWIDHKTAYFIKISADHSPIVEKIDSGFNRRNVSPLDEKTSIKLAHSIFNKHDKLQQHQHHELHAFYAVIINKLRDIDYVYLLGPGEAKHGLNREILKEGRHFRCKIVGIEASDKITLKQMQEKVREFFTSLKYEDAVRQLGS
jgi:hypothetical protein